MTALYAARCRWCGRYVAHGTALTTRTVHGVVDDVLAWRTYTQTLCPTCAASWTRDTPWNRPPADLENRAHPDPTWTGTLHPSLRCVFCSTEVVGTDPEQLVRAKTAHRTTCPHPTLPGQGRASGTTGASS